MKKLAFALLTFLALPVLSHAACTSPAGAEGNVIYNSTAKMLQFCNGTVWVNAAGINPAAGGGGGGPTYAGVTTETYNGYRRISDNALINSTKLRDAECAAAFAGSRMMRSSDLKYLTADITSSDQAWIICDNPYVDGSNNAYCRSITGAYGSYGSSSVNCNHWNSMSGSHSGFNYRGSDGGAGTSACSSSQKLHCVTD